jgi:hypothetical protein
MQRGLYRVRAAIYSVDVAAKHSRCISVAGVSSAEIIAVLS